MFNNYDIKKLSCVEVHKAPASVRLLHASVFTTLNICSLEIIFKLL